MSHFFMVHCVDWMLSQSADRYINAW